MLLEISRSKRLGDAWRIIGAGVQQVGTDRPRLARPRTAGEERALVELAVRTLWELEVTCSLRAAALRSNAEVGRLMRMSKEAVRQRLRVALASGRARGVDLGEPADDEGDA